MMLMIFRSRRGSCACRHRKPPRDNDYNIFRRYRPSWGRYKQSDPKGLRGDINLYRYARNNPYPFIDPLGLQLYVPGPSPSDNPFVPPPKCPPGPWEFVTTKTYDKGLKG